MPSNRPIFILPVAGAALGLLAAMTPACTGSEDTLIPDLPDEESPPPEDTGPFEFPEDTDLGGPTDLEPLHTLYMYQDGALSLTPSGGPWTAVTGTLEVIEFIDYERPAPPSDTDPVDTDPRLPWERLEESPLICQVTYTLVGSVSEESCTGCSGSFDIEFRVASGDPEPCYDPELPEDGEIRRLGWHDGDRTVLYDYGGIGVWYPWFRGDRSADAITFAWAQQLGVSIEEEEE